MLPRGSEHHSGSSALVVVGDLLCLLMILQQEPLTIDVPLQVVSFHRRHRHRLLTSTSSLVKVHQFMMSIMPSSALSQAIASEQWDHAMMLIESKKELSRSYSTRPGFFEGVRLSTVLPIHEACANNTAPFQLVEAIVNAYPACLQLTESAYQRLPLHIACRKNANPKIVRYLVEAYTHGTLVADTLGRLPLHYALSNGADDDLVDMLLDKSPNSARGTDRRGWLPLHVACSVGASTHVVDRILKAYPEASIIQTVKGTSVEKCMEAHQAANKGEVLQLLAQYRSLVHNRLGKPAKRPSIGRDVV